MSDYLFTPIATGFTAAVVAIFALVARSAFSIHLKYAVNEDDAWGRLARLALRLLVTLGIVLAATVLVGTGLSDEHLTRRDVLLMVCCGCSAVWLLAALR
ncbi:MAG: hypothetical protein KDJ27_03860 [Gammaproteobacteria bacterium]|nr:hypothetical protein [Gammaproteobacteria bacterium]